jgi:5-methylthioribose kinase
MHKRLLLFLAQLTAPAAIPHHHPHPPQARMATEAACMRICHAAAPGAVPAFVHFDSAAGVIASEYLEVRARARSRRQQT